MNDTAMNETAAIAERLSRGLATPEETRELVRAVLLDDSLDPAGEVDESVIESALDETPPWLTDEAIDRFQQLGSSVEGERLAAADSLSALLSLAGDDRASALDGELAHRLSWELVDLLRERSFAAGPQDPAEARELARLAVEVAGRLDGGDESLSAGLRADLLGRAWAQLGNAERVASDLPAARSALETAASHLRRGTGDPALRAQLLAFRASLQSDRSQFDSAIELARRSASLYRRLHDDHGVGRTLLQLATYYSYVDELELACETFDRALGHLDPAEEPRLCFVAHLNRASCLERSGRMRDAIEELTAAGDLAEADLDRLRVRWLSGRFAVQQGETEAGERQLSALRAEWIERDLGYEAALVSLELATLYAEQDRIADQKRLAEEMVPLFTARGVHAEARAALMLFCDAVRREEASVSLARGVAEYLERARDRPDLAFRPKS